MKNILVLIISFCGAISLTAQKRISELTLVYDAKVTTGNAEPKMADAFDGATTTIYLKGTLTRSELVSAVFSPPPVPV